ncbi:MAG: sigma 54-interacting transcriptional regulator [Clostridia bacterium]
MVQSLSGQIKELKEQINRLQREYEKLHQENAELKLRESQYNSILNTMNEVVERDAQDMSILYVNKAFCDFYGVTEKEVLHTDTMEWVIEEDRKLIGRIIEKISQENPDYHYRCRIRNKKGKISWIEVFGHAFFDENGVLKEYQDISRDITSYKEAEKQATWFRTEMEEKVRERTMELTTANQRLSTINSYLQYTLNHITEGIIIIEENGDVMFLNYGSNTIWSTCEQNMRDELKRIILHEKESVIYHLIHHKENFNNVELTLPAANGDIQYLVSGSYIQNENNPPQGILILQPMAQMRHLVNRFSSAQAKYHFNEIIGESFIMREAISLAQRVAASEGNIMIEGESGTGKELFAQSIHNASPRRHGPFIAVNCGAIPRDLIASELFGYTDGSFTGAKKGGKPGKFEMAAGGTIFLDEIGDMPLEQQITLLRVIQERTVTRIGGTKSISIDVRIICATNKDLLREVERENFRQDLYYRLNVINLHIPPLRERKEDIPLLFQHFFSKLAKSGIPIGQIADKAFLGYLTSYHWPGNVRELQNVTERAFFVSHQLPFTAADLPRYILRSKQEEKKPDLTEQIQNINQRKYEAETILSEKEQILHLLERFNNNASRVAKEMNISRTTLYRKFKKYNITKTQ